MDLDVMLRDSAGRSARRTALDLLAGVHEAKDRLDDPSDGEALHDFRVALRRLRSWLRAFRGVLRDTLAARDERRLKRIASATGASRDLEVHIDWVKRERRSLRGPARRGADWLLERLRRDKKLRDDELRNVIDDEFDRAMSRAEKALTYFEARVVGEDPRYATVVAALLRDHAAVLGTALANVRSANDRDETHAARIAAKRLRYLVEPFVAEVPPATELVEELRSLQNVLGELHDAQLFGSQIVAMVADLSAERAGGIAARKVGRESGQAPRTARNDPAVGLNVLSRRLAQTETAAFDSFAATWSDESVGSLWSHVALVEGALNQSATPRAGTKKKRAPVSPARAPH